MTERRRINLALPQFGEKYDVEKMRRLVEEIERLAMRGGGRGGAGGGGEPVPGPAGPPGPPGSSGPPGPPGEVIAGAFSVGTHYFVQGFESDIESYDVATICPADIETSITKVLTNGDNLIGVFSTSEDMPGLCVIDHGTWVGHVYYRAAEASGSNVVRIEIYKRSAGGAETHLMNVSSESLNSTSPAESMFEYEQTKPIKIETDERIVYKIFIERSGGDMLFTMRFNGHENPSHIHTPFVPMAELSGNLGQIADLDCCGVIVRDCDPDGDPEVGEWEPVDPEYNYAVILASGEWTPPAYFADIPEHTRYGDVLVVGGGGGAGSNLSGTGTRGGGGGGAGQVKLVERVPIAPGESASIVIGTGSTGLSATVPDPTPPGNPSSFTVAAGVHTALGGGGGQRFIGSFVPGSPENVLPETGGGASGGGGGGGAAGAADGADLNTRGAGGGTQPGGAVTNNSGAGAGGGGAKTAGETPADTGTASVGRGGDGFLLSELFGASYESYLVDRGDWSAGVSYVVGDRVRKAVSGSSKQWFIAQEDNTGVDPQPQPQSVWRRIIHDGTVFDNYNLRNVAVGGGGGGGKSSTTEPTPDGGIGGGGRGSTGSTAAGLNGHPNTGGGGGGNWTTWQATGGTGLVIVRYLTEASAMAQPAPPVIGDPSGPRFRCAAVIGENGIKVENGRGQGGGDIIISMDVDDCCGIIVRDCASESVVCTLADGDPVFAARAPEWDKVTDFPRVAVSLNGGVITEVTLTRTATLNRVQLFNDGVTNYIERHVRTLNAESYTVLSEDTFNVPINWGNNTVGGGIRGSHRFQALTRLNAGGGPGVCRLIRDNTLLPSPDFNAAAGAKDPGADIRHDAVSFAFMPGVGLAAIAHTSFLEPVGTWLFLWPGATEDDINVSLPPFSLKLSSERLINYKYIVGQNVDTKRILVAVIVADYVVFEAAPDLSEVVATGAILPTGTIASFNTRNPVGLFGSRRIGFAGLDTSNENVFMEYEKNQDGDWAPLRQTIVGAGVGDEGATTQVNYELSPCLVYHWPEYYIYRYCEEICEGDPNAVYGWRCLELQTNEGTGTLEDNGTRTHQNGRLVINNARGQHGTNPQFDLAEVTQAEGGTPQAITVDAWGRVVESRALTSEDIEAIGISSTARFPVVTGEIPPQLVYTDDGSLVYIEV